MAALISSQCRSSCLAAAAISDAVLLIPWVQLAVFNVKFCTFIGCTALWVNIRWNGK